MNAILSHREGFDHDRPPTGEPDGYATGRFWPDNAIENELDRGPLVSRASSFGLDTRKRRSSVAPQTYVPWLYRA
jgi:hypothetical protein